jgi:hypothetical protein
MTTLELVSAFIVGPKCLIRLNPRERFYRLENNLDIIRRNNGKSLVRPRPHAEYVPFNEFRCHAGTAVREGIVPSLDVVRDLILSTPQISSFLRNQQESKPFLQNHLDFGDVNSTIFVSEVICFHKPCLLVIIPQTQFSTTDDLPINLDLVKVDRKLFCQTVSIEHARAEARNPDVPTASAPYPRVSYYSQPCDFFSLFVKSCFLPKNKCDVEDFYDSIRNDKKKYKIYEMIQKYVYSDFSAFTSQFDNTFFLDFWKQFIDVGIYDDGFDMVSSVEEKRNMAYALAVARNIRIREFKSFIIETSPPTDNLDLPITQGPSWLSSAMGLPVEELNDLIIKMSKTVDEVSSTVNSTKDSVEKNFPKFVSIAYIGYFVYALMKYWFYKDTSALLQIGWFSALVAVFLPREIISVITSLMPTDSVVSQSLDFSLPWDSIITLFTLATAYFTGISMKDMRFRPKDVVSAISSLPSLDKGIKYFVTAVTDILFSCLNYVRDKFFGLHPILSSKTGVKEVDDFLKRVEPMITKSWYAQPPYTMSDYEEIMALQSIAGRLALAKSYGDRSTDANVRRIISTTIALLEKIRRPYDSSSLRAKFSKCEPIVILLRGKPGQGKSYFGLLLAKMIASLFVPGAKDRIDDHEAEYIYTRAPETVYWDGYCGQFITFLDDLGQSTDQRGQADSEYMNFIRMVNTFQSPLHMAEISQKANTFFQSRFVIATTNHEDFNGVSSINFMDAFRRRFDIVLDVEVNPELEIDPSPLPPSSTSSVSSLQPAHPVTSEQIRKFESEFSCKARYKYARVSHENTLMLDISKVCNDSVVFKRVKGIDPSKSKEIMGSYDVFSLMDMIKNVHDSKTKFFQDSVDRSSDMINEVYTKLGTPSPSCDIQMFSVPCDDYDDETTEESGFSSDDTDSEVDDELVPQGPLSRFHYFILSCKKFFPSFKESTYAEATRFYDYAFTPTSRYFNSLCDLAVKSYYRIADFLANKFNEFVKSGKKMSDVLAKFTSTYTMSKIASVFSDAFRYIKATVVVTTQYIDALSKASPGFNLLLQFIETYAIFRLMVGVYWLFSSKQDTKSQGMDASAMNVRKGDSNKQTFRYAKNAQGKLVRIETEIAAQAPHEQLNQVAQKVTNKNTMVIKRAGYDEIWARSTVIRGCIAMIPSHYFHLAASMISSDPSVAYGVLEFYTVNGVKFKETTISEFLQCDRVDVDQTDLSLYCIPGKLRTFPDIVKHFISGDHLPQKYIDINLICANNEGGYINHRTEAIMCSSPLHYVSTTGKKFMVNRSFSYRADTTSGDCGSLLIAENLSFFPSPIMGFHIASRTNKEPIGYANVITKQILERALSHFDEIDKQGPPIEDFPHFRNSNYDFVYKEFRVASSTKVPIGMSVKSQLRKTEGIFGIFGPCPYAPAVMSPYYDEDGDRINPLNTATVKYQQTSPYIPIELLDITSDDLVSDIIESSSPYVHYNLSFEQAVAGIPGIPYMDGIPRGTSAGYPYCKTKPPGKKGKKAFFGEVGDYEFDSPMCHVLRKEVSSIIENARAKKRMIHIYSDFLKDELRPKHKVHKPRLVSCAPLPFTIAYRQLLLPMNAWFMSNRVNNGMAVGINPFQEWSRIVYRLQQSDDNPCYIAGDFKGFDTRIGSVFQYAISKIFRRILSDVTSNDPSYGDAIDILLLEVFSSVHVANDVIYYWTSGQPSGNPGTTIINCLVNRLLLRMCWVVVNKHDLASVSKFKINVKDIVYGDDNVISVSEEARSMFNPDSLALAMQEFNMEYTSESKDHSVSNFRHVTEVSFLKRDFVWDPELGIYVAPLDIDTVTFMMYYHNKSKDFKLNIQMTFESLLDELSLHEQHIYEEYYSTLAPVMFNSYDYVAAVVDYHERRKKTLLKDAAY